MGENETEFKRIRGQLVLEVHEVLQDKVWKKVRTKRGKMLDTKVMLNAEERVYYEKVLLPKYRKKLERLKLWDSIHGTKRWDK